MDDDLAATRRQGSDRRQLVDESGHFLRPDFEPAGSIALDDDRAARLARFCRRDVDFNPGAETPEDVEQRRPRRIEADVLDLDPRPWERRGANQPERGGREVAGDHQRAALEALTAGDGHGQPVDRHAAAERGHRPLGMVARSRRAR